MRSYGFGRVVDVISAKGLQTDHYAEVTEIDVGRSSGALLRSRGGIPQSELSSIQHGDSSGGCEIPRARV